MINPLPTAHTPLPTTPSRRDLARLITGIENSDEAALARARALYAYGGHARTVGVTGPPGSGKSTLIAALAQAARQRAWTVAILSVDPSSPFTGGAILGDRIRMRDLHADNGIFIRSMASRGAAGGIASATADVVALLDAAGFDLIFIETVGAGQSEVEIARVAETVIVVEAPGLGDDVQAIKAGILEIADILVVNKADRDGAEATVSALKAALELGAATSGHGRHSGHHGYDAGAHPTSASAPGTTHHDGWATPILKTIATRGEGVEVVLDAIEQHARVLAAANHAEQQVRRLRRAEQEVLLRLRDLWLQHAVQQLDVAELREMSAAVSSRQIHPEAAARQLLDKLRRI
jgi:LAO/AO transport system kinase